LRDPYKCYKILKLPLECTGPHEKDFNRCM